MTDARLQRLDQVADARCRMYAHELRALIQVAAAFGDKAVAVTALESLADRMAGTTASDPPETGAVIELHGYSRKEPA